MVGQSPRTTDSQIKFLNSLGGLPFEYRADLILTAVERNDSLLKSMQVQSRLWEIFNDAYLARHPYAQALAARTENDSAEGAFSGAQRTERLDSLDITTRVLKLLAQVDPRRVYRDTLNVQVDPPAADCTNAYAYNTAPFYDFVAANAATWLKDGAVTPPKLRPDLEVHLLNSLSSASVSSMIGLLAFIPLNRDDLEVLTAELANKESRLTPTDRELGFLITEENLLANTDKLATRLDSANLSSYQLLAGLKAVLLSGTRVRCGDTLISSVETAKAYNALITKHQPAANDLHLADNALKGVKSNVKAELHPIDPTGAESSIIQTLMRYANRSDTNPVVSDVPGWDSASDALLHEVVYDPPHEACEICNFYAKSMTYYLLENFSPDVPISSAKELALRAFAGFLTSERLSNMDPVAWLSQFKLLINLSRQPNPDAKRRIEGLRAHGYHLQGLPSPSGVVVAHELERSGDKVARAYAEFDRQFHTPYLSPY